MSQTPVDISPGEIRAGKTIAHIKADGGRSKRLALFWRDGAIWARTWKEEHIALVRCSNPEHAESVIDLAWKDEVWELEWGPPFFEAFLAERTRLRMSREQLAVALGRLGFDFRPNTFRQWEYGLVEPFVVAQAILTAMEGLEPLPKHLSKFRGMYGRRV